MSKYSKHQNNNDLYIVIDSCRLEDLEDYVEKAIQDGYIPTGGIYVAVSPGSGCFGSNDYHYYQAMVLKEIIDE